jgi:hypothetical protein
MAVHAAQGECACQIIWQRIAAAAYSGVAETQRQCCWRASLRPTWPPPWWKSLYPRHLVQMKLAALYEHCQGLCQHRCTIPTTKREATRVLETNNHLIVMELCDY